MVKRKYTAIYGALCIVSLFLYYMSSGDPDGIYWLFRDPIKKRERRGHRGYMYLCVEKPGLHDDSLCRFPLGEANFSNPRCYFQIEIDDAPVGLPHSSILELWTLLSL